MTENSELALPYIILGLGNPGERYVGNRHNIGAQVASVFARRHKIRIEHVWGDARVGEGTVDGRAVIVAHSRTHMNESGKAVLGLQRRTGLAPDRLIVLCDQLDLPLGKMRLREWGSTAGQNGLRSIENQLGSQDFPRLRLGIDRPVRPFEMTLRQREIYEEAVVRWVLSPFSKEEEPAAQELRERACDALDCLLMEGITVAMNRYN